jgi:hypothetical protein
MTTPKYFKSIVGRHLLLAALALSIVMVATAACNLPGGESDEPEEPVDPDAQPYRMYFDSSADADENELQIRYFTGQLRLADIEGIFGDTEDLPEDDNGNHVGGPTLKDGLIWSLSLSPSQVGVNLMSRDLDGTLSSAIDLDGDEIVDILDIWLGDGRRFTFVTEGLGMGVFELWLLGRNPLCNIELSPEAGLEEFAIWNCADDEDGGGEGAAGASGAPGPGSGYVDPFDLMCADYDSLRPGFNRQVVGQVSGETVFQRDTIWQEFGEGGSAGTRSIDTFVASNEVGEHLYTIKIIRDFDASGEMVQEVRESVNPDGVGSRSILKVYPDGSTAARSEFFEAEVEEDGDYDADSSDPPPPVPNPPDEGPPEEEPPPPPPEADPGDPGPFGDDSTLAEFCARRGTPSGVEQAAATDPTAFEVSCGDLVGAPTSGDDCTIFDWARAGDFEGALEGSNDHNCDPFMDAGPDETCGNKTGIQRMRGNTAFIASLNLPDVVLCSPLVCGGLITTKIEAREDVSTTDVAPEDFATVTPTPEPSSEGFIPGITICYWGPGPEYGTVSSLAEGIYVEIVGVGEIAGWLIVDNPNFDGVSCWVDEEDVELPPDLDLSLLPEFEIPALPEDGGGDDGGGALTAPSNLKATTICASPTYNVKLTWNDNSTSESGFRIYRDGSLIGAVGADVTRFTDNNPNDSFGHTYTVRAYNAAGESSAVTVDSVGCIF